MQTPRQLARLGEILSKENPETAISVSDYIKSAMENKAYPLGDGLRISPSGKLEATAPRPEPGKPAFPARLKTRALVRTVTRCALAGFPIGFATKEWLGTALRAADFRAEAEKMRKNQSD